MDSSYNRNILYSEITPSEFPQLPYQAFSEWTLEEKAEFSDAFYLQMVDHMSSRPNYRGVYYYATLHRYGLPGCDDLSQEQAVQIARKAATTVGANQDYLSRANARVYFDVTDEDKHQWKIYLSTLFSYNTRFGDSIGYFVVLDAATGDVLNIYEHTANSPKELFY